MTILNEKQKIIMYGTAICPGVPPMKGLFQQAKVNYDYINISQNTEARARVRQINNGYESVPTLEFPDGSTLTEPSVGEVKRKLEAMGYKVPLQAMLMGNLWLIFIVVMIAFALARAFGLF